MTLLGRLGVLAALAVGVLFVTGCGETVIDSAKTEAAIEENLEKSVGQKVASVDCPSGVEVKAGTTFECTVSLQNGKRETATLKILNSDADVEVTDLKSAGGK
jgi:hypothetical protein